MSDSYRLGILLALTGGYLDAYTYLIRGGVFANAQTGNIVLLGVSLAQGSWGRAGYYLVPIITFALGILLSEVVRGRGKNATYLHWRQVVLILEIAILAVASQIPRGELDVLVNVAVSFVCALQVQSFRKVDGNSMATTMCTGNLRSGTELLYRSWVTKDLRLLYRAGEYYGIIVAFVTGAGMGALISIQVGERAVLLPCLILAVGMLLMFSRQREKKS